MQAILAINAGSSSVKFTVFEIDGAGEKLSVVVAGKVAHAGLQAELTVHDSSGALIEKSCAARPHDRFDHDDALNRVFTWLGVHRSGLQLVAIGHRVVHGGMKYAAPVVIDAKVLRDLDALVPMAPLHQADNLRAIRIASERWPQVPQVACFDTAFHTTQPKVAKAMALPRRLSEAGIRRFGFHGLSYEYIARQLPRALGPHAGGRIVVAHLGNGASLCAMVNGRSVATTMGFSVLDGLVMGTRCGSLDAGVVLYLQQQMHMSVQEVSDLLYQHSGLLGVSDISGDMRLLLDSRDSRAAEAIDLYVYRIVCEIGAMAAAMGGIDALVFTAGIGERAAVIRSRICAGCEWLGAGIDEAANRVDRELIHSASSRMQLAVIPTNEEQVIAMHSMAHRQNPQAKTTCPTPAR